MDFGDRERPHPSLNIAPLIDIVFLMLVFFMLASTFIEPQAIDLVLPGDGVPGNVSEEPLLVDVATDGQIALNGLSLSLDQLGPELSGRLGGDVGRAITVRADADVAVQLLVTVMDRIRSTGTRNVRLATPDAQ